MAPLGDFYDTLKASLIKAQPAQIRTVFKMARRTGVPTMMAIARRLCDLINKFSPVIASTYPGNAALMAALAAANAACSALHMELIEVREFGD